MATRALIEWIAKCLRPLSIVEDEELRFFITLVQTMHGIYELPSRRTITERMQAHGQQLRSLLKEKIAEEVDFYSLTTDMWTSRTTDSYIAYTLEVASFCGKHTGVRIRKKVRDLMYTWGLDISRVSKVVRDNGANIVKACHELGVDHFGCMAHSLHLVVSGALAKTKAEVMDESNGDVDEQEGGAVDELAEVDDGEEHWVEDPSMELEAIAFLENELVGLETYVAANSVRQEALGVEMLDVADDSLDEGLLNGCMSANAAKTILKAMKQAMCES
ncbi:putative zinc finger bed domain-containing protein 1-like [Phytophthora infestans]|uniref:Putative zinc finger bed domain-containing protein 1-like n=1 Tax=Phytophthora infestans TaxID=4787 RepID=A0A8S9UZ21_PHYIN|nr:putative zinc finger bed domain-containing protein 1-like [Phytophthora infestans]